MIQPEDFVRRRRHGSAAEEAPIRLVVTGEFACFAAPHARVEAVSQLAPPPSPMRRLLTRLYGKPEHEWMILAIDLLVEPSTHRTVHRHLTTKGQVREFTDRTHTLQSCLWLNNVAYCVHADLVPNPDRARRSRESYLAEARKRLAQGQMFAPPFLGRSDVLADWLLLADDEVTTRPVDLNGDLGWMTLEMIPILPPGAGARGSVTSFADLPHEAVSFWGRLEHGVLRVPVDRWKAEVLPRLFAARNALPSTAESAAEAEGGAP